MSAVPLWTAPLPLVVSEADMGLKVCDEAVRQLSLLNTPVSVVAVVGRYRSGKSFLLNKLAGVVLKDSTDGGFQLGSTVQSQTKGIWVWPVSHPNDPHRTVILIDTEGLGDIEKGSKDHDCWIFVLSILLSSILIFNTQSTISHEGFEQLHFVSNMTDLVKTKVHSDPDEAGEDFSEFFPHLVVCVRDFSLRLEVNGKPLTADEFLEHCLTKRKPGKSRESREYNGLRENLESFFKKRKCFVLSPPELGDKTQELDQLADDELNEKFVEQLKALRDYVFTSARPKVVDGIALNGKAWVTLALEYTEALMSNAIPCIESSLTRMTKAVNEEAKKESINVYDTGMKSKLQRLPVSMEKVLECHERYMKEALTEFAKRCVLDKEKHYAREVNLFLERQLQEWTRKNESESELFCRDLLRVERRPRKEFLKAGGHKEFTAMINKIQKTYEATSNKGPKACEVMARFMEEVNLEEQEILKVDKTLTEMERKCRIQEADRRMAEEEKKAMQEKVNRLQASFDALTKQYEETVQILIEKLNEIEQETETHGMAFEMLQSDISNLQHRHPRNTEDVPPPRTCNIM
ncbi:guanylate-binding protein 1-like [Protopterus annectens]|uniref:guanylate-binding protein 1-like n=1 Tax=Protopterus annectens TaxID=7888 RepID=UPI001CFAA51C|nr:guanylate-binding protein 1-like [Protopterus annectens]